MRNDILAKLVVTVVVMIAFAIWLTVDKAHTAHCQTDCPTDISASRR